ncbi:hypothetical protein UlMin_043373 [Ulmus minor]
MNSEWNDSCFEQYYYSFFKQIYRCYQVSRVNNANIENGDRVLMPLSALDLSHCGVIEFSSEEGEIILPNWMMENLKLEEEETVVVKNVSLPKGTFVKLQPHKKDLMELSNPKAVLEKTLSGFSCLTAGDTIMIMYGDNKFLIDVLEAKPSSAVSVIDTDCEVDLVDQVADQLAKFSTLAISSEGSQNKANLEEEGKVKEVEKGFQPFIGKSYSLG